MGAKTSQCILSDRYVSHVVRENVKIKVCFY